MSSPTTAEMIAWLDRELDRHPFPQMIVFGCPQFYTIACDAPYGLVHCVNGLWFYHDVPIKIVDADILAVLARSTKAVII